MYKKFSKFVNRFLVVDTFAIIVAFTYFYLTCKKLYLILSLAVTALCYLSNGVILSTKQEGYMWKRYFIVVVKGKEAFKRGIFEMVLALIIVLIDIFLVYSRMNFYSK